MKTAIAKRSLAILSAAILLVSTVMSLTSVLAAAVVWTDPTQLTWHDGAGTVTPQSGILTLSGSASQWKGIFPVESGNPKMVSNSDTLDIRYKIKVRDYASGDVVFLSFMNNNPSADIWSATQSYAVQIEGTNVMLRKNNNYIMSGSDVNPNTIAYFGTSFNLADGAYHNIAISTSSVSGGLKIEVKFDGISKLNYTDASAPTSGTGGFRFGVFGCSLDVGAESTEVAVSTFNSPSEFVWYNNSMQQVQPSDSVYSITSSTAPVAMAPVQGAAPFKTLNDVTLNYKFRLRDFSSTSSYYFTFKDTTPENEPVSRTGLYALYFDGTRSLVLLTKNCAPIMNPASPSNLLPSTVAQLNSSLNLADGNYHTMSISYTTVGQTVQVKISFDGTEKLTYTDSAPYAGPGGFRVGVTGCSVDLAASSYNPDSNEPQDPVDTEIPSTLMKITNPTLVKWYGNGTEYPSAVYQPVNNVLVADSAVTDWHTFEAVNVDSTGAVTGSAALPLEFDLSLKIRLKDFISTSNAYLTFRDSAPNSDPWVGNKYGIYFEGDKMSLKKNNQHLTTTPNTTMRWYETDTFTPGDNKEHSFRLAVFNVNGDCQIVVFLDGEQILSYLDTEPLTGTGMRIGVSNTIWYIAPADGSTNVPDQASVPGNLTKINDFSSGKWMLSGKTVMISPSSAKGLTFNGPSGDWVSIYGSGSDSSARNVGKNIDVNLKFKFTDFLQTKNSSAYITFRDTDATKNPWARTGFYQLAFEGDKLALKKNSNYITTDPNTTMLWYNATFNPVDGKEHTLRLAAFDTANGDCQIYAFIDGQLILSYLDTQPVNGSQMKIGASSVKMTLLPLAAQNIAESDIIQISNDMTIPNTGDSLFIIVGLAAVSAVLLAYVFGRRFAK